MVCLFRLKQIQDSCSQKFNWGVKAIVMHLFKQACDFLKGHFVSELFLNSKEPNYGNGNGHKSPLVILMAAFTLIKTRAYE